MTANARRATLLTYLLGLFVVVVALGTRVYYLTEFQFINSGPNQIWQVQGRGLVMQPPQVTELDQLVTNAKKDGVLNGYRSNVPLGPEKEELTAFRAPLYPLFRVGVELGSEKVNEYLTVTPVAAVRYLQAFLGALTCLCYYILVWRAFGQHQLLALAVGLITAFYPMWIVNVAELEDGVLASFLLAWSLSLGIGIGQRGGVIKSLLFGLVLAALSLTRAALLPFAIVVQLWFFLICRRVKNGALCAILTLIGFVGGLTPWLLQCYQTFHTPVPLVTSAWFHVWTGNNSASDGAGYNWSMKERLKAQDSVLVTKMEQTSQQDRYALLADHVVREVTENPWTTCKRRFKALCQLLMGTNALNGARFAVGEAGPPPMWFSPALIGPLCLVYVLALLGWRWSYGWKESSTPLILALCWIPLPYLLSHAEQLHSARLPLDGVFIVLATIGLAGLLPGMRSSVLAGAPKD